MTKIKKVLTRFPRLYEAIFRLKYSHRELPAYKSSVLQNTSPEQIFSAIYETNMWQDPESRSGPGSNLERTRGIRKVLPVLMKKYGVNRLLDAPCGDFNWMNAVQFPEGFTYIGADIVPQLVESLSREFQTAHRSFMRLDVISDPLPRAQMWLCRDCFIHFSHEQAVSVLNKFADSEIDYLLTTTYSFGCRNIDINMGEFRAINLQLAPFHLPQPIESIFDFDYPFPPRRLALWTREQVKSARSHRASLHG